MIDAVLVGVVVGSLIEMFRQTLFAMPIDDLVLLIAAVIFFAAIFVLMLRAR